MPEALETVALEGYRAGVLSRGQVSEMLGLGIYETESFLKAHGALLEMTADEYEEESRALESLPLIPSRLRIGANQPSSTPQLPPAGT